MIIYPDILNKTTLSSMTVKSKSFTRATGMCLICNMLIHIFGGTNQYATYPAGINLFKVNNRNTGTRSLMSFLCLYC